jgi:hypothetical protein
VVLWSPLVAILAQWIAIVETWNFVVFAYNIQTDALFDALKSSRPCK